jgi:hypothetical protein
LIALAAIKGATVGGVTLRSLGVVEKALPVFIAYCMFRSAVFGSMRRMYRRAHRAFMAEMDPAMVANNLERYVLPADVFLFGFEGGETRTRTGRAYWRITVVLNLLIATGIFWFEGYAFYRLFSTYGADDPETWISLAATLPLLILYRWLDAPFAAPITGVRATIWSQA